METKNKMGVNFVLTLLVISISYINAREYGVLDGDDFEIWESDDPNFVPGSLYQNSHVIRRREVPETELEGSGNGENEPEVAPPEKPLNISSINSENLVPPKTENATATPEKANENNLPKVEPKEMEPIKEVFEKVANETVIQSETSKLLSPLVHNISAEGITSETPKPLPPLVHNISAEETSSKQLETTAAPQEILPEPKQNTSESAPNQFVAENFEAPKQNLTENTETPKQNLTDSTEAPKQNLAENIEVPKPDLDESIKTPKPNLTDSTDATKQNLSENTEAPKQNLTDSTEAPKLNLSENTEAPKQNLTDSSEAPKQNLAENTAAPKQNLTDNPEVPKRNLAENTEAPKLNLPENAEGPKQNLTDNTEIAKQNLPESTKAPKQNLTDTAVDNITAKPVVEKEGSVVDNKSNDTNRGEQKKLLSKVSPNDLAEEKQKETNKEGINEKQSGNTILFKPPQNDVAESVEGSESEKILMGMPKNAKISNEPNTGESAKPVSTASKDTTILVVLFVVVIAIGGAAFAHNYIKKRKQQSSANNDLVNGIRRSLQNLSSSNGKNSTDVEQGTELKPLMKNNSPSKEYSDTKKEETA